MRDEARIARESQESLVATITCDIDPTGWAIEWAFTRGADRPTTWEAGAWEGDAVQVSPGVWEARARTPIIGAGNLDLEPGRWRAWPRISGGAETPVIDDAPLWFRIT